MKIGVMFALMAMLGTPAVAQVDPATVGLSQVLRAQNEGYADRARGRTATARPSPSRVKYLCTQRLPSFRAQYGADNADVVELAGLCRRAGY